MIAHTIRLTGLLLVLAGCAGPPATVVDRTTGQVTPSSEPLPATTGSATVPVDNVAEEAEGAEAEAAAAAGAGGTASAEGAEAIVPAPEHAVALLLPLGDERPTEAARALALMHAADMAVDDLTPGTIRLQVYDTSTGAAAAAEQAIADGAALLLGPMFAAAVREVSDTIRAAGIRSIAFSTDRSVAGDSVYLIGSLPEAEFLRVLRYAAENGHARIAALVPATPYGEIAAVALDEVTFAPGTLLQPPSVVRYAPAFESARLAAEQFAAARTRRLEQIPGTESTAVLIADSGPNLETIVGFLDSAGVTAPDIRLLGSGVWDSSAVVENELMRGAWFAVPDPRLRSAFATRYRDRHGSEPPALAALAYDAVAIAGLLAMSGGADPFSDRAIQDRAGFAGVTGLIRFDANGLNERAFAILEVTEDGFQVIDPAPRSFAGES